MKQTIALFGEAEKGEFRKLHTIRELPQLVDILGNPPPDSQGLFFAVQSILYNRDLLFFRVEDEGFSDADYYNGLKLLRAHTLHALALPGVGNPDILSRAIPLTPLLITHPKDLYDFLTAS